MPWKARAETRQMTPLGTRLAASEGVIAVGGGVSKLIESAAKPGDEALPLQPGDSGRSDAGPADFGQAGYSALAQEGREPFPLCAGLRRYRSSGRLSFHPRKCIMRTEERRVGKGVVSTCRTRGFT